MRKIFQTASLAVGLALAMASAASAAPSATVGHQLFQQDCIVCHHSDGRGGVHFGRGVVSADLRAPGLENTYHHNDALIVRAILFGRDESDQPLHAPMPHWHGTLTTAQARDIVAYLHTLKN